MTRAPYKIELEPRARRRLALLDAPVRRRVVGSIDKLAVQPRPSGAVALTGRPGVLRVRSGDYRILYEVRDNQLIVLVMVWVTAGRSTASRARHRLVLVPPLSRTPFPA